MVISRVVVETRPKGSFYLPPGSVKWQIVRDETGRELRRGARRLLMVADAQLRRQHQARRSREMEMLAFDREMSKRMGAWEKWIALESEKLTRDVDERLRSASEKLARDVDERLRSSVKRLFKK